MTRLLPSYTIAVDLGQVNDSTAIAVAERTELRTGRIDLVPNVAAYFDGNKHLPRTIEWPQTVGIYDLIHLQRLPLGTPYTALPETLRTIEQRLRQRWSDLVFQSHHVSPSMTNTPVELIVDQTGVGRPVVDLLRDAALPCRLVPIMITGGQTVTQTEEQVGWVKEIGFHVPKRDLVGVLAVLLQSERIRVAQDLHAAQLLVQELLNFRVKISLSGRDSYGAGEEWRDGAHDDLVLAVALAAWYGENPATVPMGVVAFGKATIKMREPGMARRGRAW